MGKYIHEFRSLSLLSIFETLFTIFCVCVWPRFLAPLTQELRISIAEKATILKNYIHKTAIDRKLPSISLKSFPFSACRLQIFYQLKGLLFVSFRVSLRVHGSAFAGFHQVPSTVWQVSLVTGDWRILLLCFYIPALFTESFDRLGRRNVFASKVPEWELNLSYTAQVDPFPSALSTRPTLLPKFCCNQKLQPVSMSDFLPC